MKTTSFKTLTWITLGCSIFFFAFFSREKNIESFMYNVLMSALYTFSLGLSNGYANDYLTKRFSWVDQTKTRAVAGIIVIVVLNVIVVYACNYVNLVIIRKVATPEEFFSKEHLVTNWFMINFALMISAFLHARGFVEELKKNTRQQVVEQKLIAKSANAQYESLKNQLDPHFLFNSLNVLTALIDENPSQAQKFTASMSKIYRYVLEQKDKETVSVEDEIQFAKTYCALLKTRFEDSVCFDFDIPESTLKMLVVPLSLQLLLENCIKHNFATSSKPLNIRIFSEGGFLCVENNLQVREQLKESAGIGLSNIVQRYALVSNLHVYIEKSEEKFKVKLPLLTNIKSQNMKTYSNSSEEFAYQKALKRVKEIKDFYSNLVAYIIVNVFLAAINLLTSPDKIWFIWPMLGWGIGLGIHAMKTFAIGKNWEERKIKEYMNHNNN